MRGGGCGPCGGAPQPSQLAGTGEALHALVRPSARRDARRAPVGYVARVPVQERDSMIITSSAHALAPAHRRRAGRDRQHAARRVEPLSRRPRDPCLGEARGRQSRRQRQGPPGGADARPTRSTEGSIAPGTTVIESTSGNMGVGLAQACRYHGLQLICVVDARAHDTNVRTLRALGADVRVVVRPDPADRRPAGRRLDARARAARDDAELVLAEPVRQRVEPGGARRRDDARDRRGAGRGPRLPLRRDEHRPARCAVAATTCAAHGRADAGRGRRRRRQRAVRRGPRAPRELPGFGAGVETELSRSARIRPARARERP